MSEPAAPSPAAPANDLATLTAAVAEQTKALAGLAKASYPAGFSPSLLAGSPPNVTRQLGERPYSYIKAAAFAAGQIEASEAAEERQISDKLAEVYGRYQFNHHMPGRKSFLVPYSTAHMPAVTPADQSLQLEVRQKMVAGSEQVDPDEAEWLARKIPQLRKALGTVTDTAGGALVGFPTLGEVIDLQRNLESFVNAGASEVTLPPNGRIQFPKLTGGATAYWVGEGQAITESQQTLGSLDLSAKKLAVLVKLNNELLRFTTPTTEALVRTDMARVGALKADAAYFAGTGGTQVRGLLTYTTAAAWVAGQDRLIAHTAATTGTDGDTFTPQDVALMASKLPDMVNRDRLAWLFRRTMFAAITNRRADAVNADDARGPFVFDITRSAADPRRMALRGHPVVESSQVPGDRVKGSGTNLTVIILGQFSDWLIARHGVMEFMVTGQGDTAFVNDQLWIRAIQHLDAGPRHASSFVICDSLLES